MSESFHSSFFGTISNTGTIDETPQDWTQYLGIFKHLPIKNVQIYERWTTFLYFKTKIVLWIWIQNLWFGSGTREKPSGYTTITIFNIRMGYFFFWPKNGVSAIKVSLWYFKILSRFYLFNLCCWFFIMGDNFQWTGMSHLGHSSHSATFW